ncbi:MAG: Re/Si-specific NAD(P)(+) transhydrogenase subunit alpha [Gammaproteobacteria bacterium]|jgi:NAD(P) transhydrogenase subunit alpha|nr:Re/Si-specific NAD(P)(+) transhydrogenase subunit alpha [Gammaproteobacteria bacterium]MBT7523645.1 Re/Si-specific NAD(P)(+) transhydrogenase subunit alpha [Gammaproteobacteria bacterium]MBT7814592.1 Re/Si-specific NAD(P)(+) transhydrogenase subunit alpha [Gammaproteobacteria bacterium]
MKISIPKENRAGETRVAASPEVVKKFTAMGFEVTIESGAGLNSGFTDEIFKNAGAKIASDTKSTLENADIVFKIQRLMTASDEINEISMCKKDAMVLAHMSALSTKKDSEEYAKASLTTFAMDLMPRISRAQSMDVLSSQSNLSGYQAVIKGASNYNSAFPMMMTAAGTVAPAKVFIMGVGVAGLQAIATAKRMGAIVTAYDVRAATKEQVESLGGKFLIVDEEAMKEAETSGGYAKEMTEDYKKKEQEVIKNHIKDQDIVITTALIPGRPAPKLVTAEMVGLMKTGSVVVDLAAEMGGNCDLTKRNEVVDADGVKIVGYDNLPGELPKDASTLFAKNLLNFLSPHVNSESKSLELDWEDETVKNTLVTKGGSIVSEIVKGVS